MKMPEEVMELRATPQYCRAAIAAIDEITANKELHPAVAAFYDKARVGYKLRMYASMYGAC